MSQQVVTIRRAGAQCASFRVGSKTFSVPIWTMAVYEQRARQKDGKVTWRHVASFGATRATDKPSDRLVAEARRAAAERGIPFLAGIRQGQPVKTDS